MKLKSISTGAFVLAFALGIFLALQEVHASEVKGPVLEPPEGEVAKSLTDVKCSHCHTSSKLTSRAHPHDKEEWEETVDMMRFKGAGMTPEESEKMVDYLASNYGPNKNLEILGILPWIVTLPLILFAIADRMRKKE